MRRSHHSGKNRHQSYDEQVTRVATLALKRRKSVDFTGYWQQHIETGIQEDGSL